MQNGQPQREPIAEDKKEFPQPQPQSEELQESIGSKIQYSMAKKSKVVIMEGQEVLMIPSGFEIMTAEGWKPIMMRADKIKQYRV